MDNFLKKILAVLALAFLVVYIGYQVYQVMIPTVETETVYRYTAYQSVETTCLVVRKETVVARGDYTGYLSYAAQDGTRVAKGGVIADVYRTESDAVAQAQEDYLTQEIQTLQALQMQSAEQTTSLASVTAQLARGWNAFVSSAGAYRIEDLQQQGSQLLYLLNKQQIASGKQIDFTARIDELTRQKKELAASYQKKSASILSPVSGYFIGEADGYEQLALPEKVSLITVPQMRQLMQTPPAAVDKATIGKVAQEYDWQILCLIPLEAAESLPAGTGTTVRFPLVTDQALAVDVVVCNKDKSGEAALVLSCNVIQKELIGLRKEQLQIRVAAYDGLRVPDTALQFVTDPQTGAQQSGVYVRKGNTIYFKKIRVIYHSEKESYSVCAFSEDADYLQLYDTIVTGGKNLYDGKVV
ncbi:MAG: hypothetical protein IKI50_05570 [Clostridia bacterium]|nr:hypothetical protein [Clostridia bacterium]